MEKITPIPVELINKAKKLNIEIFDIEEIIIDRMNYVIRFLYKTFSKNEKFSWWFDGAEEGEVGDFWSNYESYTGEIQFCTDVGCSNMEIIDKNGDLWVCEGSIPDRWLFEDFENEIIEGKRLLEERNAKKDLEKFQLKERNKSERQKLIDSAKAKLTKQELKALGLSKL